MVYTPTDFSNWVFKKQNPSYRNIPYNYVLKNLRKGRDDHLLIDEAKFRYSREIFGIDKKTTWDLVYRDDQRTSQSLKSGYLFKNGECLRCKPDLVFAGKDNVYVVVERKTTKHPNPQFWDSDLAQLWCYGHLDMFKKSDRVLLALEYWKSGSLDNKRLMDARSQPSDNGLGLIKHKSFLRGDKDTYKKFKKLFIEWGGEIINPNS